MKPILFIDFDGTLCHDRFWRSIDVSSFEKIQSFFFGENKSMVNEWMRGIHSSEHINQLISKELNIPFKEVWSIFVADCENMNIPVGVLNRIENLRKNYQTILITDNMDCFTRFTVPVLKLDSYFDSIVNSFDNKKLKNDNDGDIFLQVANERGSKIEESILMDNSKGVCNTFSKFGGATRLVTSEKPLAFWLENLENAQTSLTCTNSPLGGREGDSRFYQI
jgi:FMN phosphatase YigB (HAD superfamily)